MLCTQPPRHPEYELTFFKSALLYNRSLFRNRRHTDLKLGLLFENGSFDQRLLLAATKAVEDINNHIKDLLPRPPRIEVYQADTLNATDGSVRTIEEQMSWLKSEHGVEIFLQGSSNSVSGSACLNEHKDCLVISPYFSNSGEGVSSGPSHQMLADLFTDLFRQTGTEIIPC